tara:strand:+ start:1055 stop:2080 length:1026 start_codon:yes stop_codon:yes gene_type:complete
MKIILRTFILIIISIIIFSIYITRDGEVITPEGKGILKLNSGIYEAFALPDFASRMIDIDYKSYFIEVESGLKIHVLEKGQGFPVLLMHGNPTSGFLYRNIVNNLPLDKVRVIMPSLMGLGFSSKIPASMHTLDNHIRWINIVLTELKLTEVIYAGQDWGGPIGMGALSLSPSLLKGAVILNTGFSAPKIKSDLSPAHAIVKTPIIGELLVEKLLPIFDRLGRVQGNPDSWTRELAELYGEPLIKSGNFKAPLALMRMVPDGPNHESVTAMLKIEEYVRSLKIPTEIVWGMNDPILGNALQLMQKNFPEAKVTETTAGHFLQEEVSFEIANALKRIIDKVI